MTIKKTTHFEFPFGQEVRITRKLGNNHHEEVAHEANRPYSWLSLDVLAQDDWHEDRLVVTPRPGYHQTVYEGEEINGLMDSIGDNLHQDREYSDPTYKKPLTSFGRKVEFSWEPTQSVQSKK